MMRAWIFPSQKWRFDRSGSMLLGSRGGVKPLGRTAGCARKALNLDWARNHGSSPGTDSPLTPARTCKRVRASIKCLVFPTIIAGGTNEEGLVLYGRRGLSGRGGGVVESSAKRTGGFLRRIGVSRLPVLQDQGRARLPDQARGPYAMRCV